MAAARAEMRCQERGIEQPYSVDCGSALTGDTDGSSGTSSSATAPWNGDETAPRLLFLTILAGFERTAGSQVTRAGSASGRIGPPFGVVFRVRFPAGSWTVVDYLEITSVSMSSDTLPVSTRV
jgi:hypothetical protein